MARFSRLIAMVCVVASLLGACSSSSSSAKSPAGDSTKVLSKAEFVKKASAICKTYAGRVDSVVNAAGTGLSTELAKQTFEKRLIPLFRSQLAELHTLRPPPADRVRIERYLGNLSAAIASISSQVPGAKSVSELNAIKPPALAEAKRFAEAYGMKGC